MTSIGILRCVVGPYLCAVPCALPSRRFCATLPSRCARMASVSTDHKPFRISGAATDAADWVADLELDSASDFGAGQAAPRILVLYGSLRSRSYSRLLAFEFCRILEKLGAEVKVFDPRELPMHDTELHSQHPKVLARPALMRVSLVRLVPCVTRLDCDVHCPQELRSLSEWSEGQLWVSPEQHGAITGVMKARAQTAMCPLVRTPRLASRNRCVLLALRRSWTGFHCRWVAFDLRRGAPLPSPRSAHPRHICFEALQNPAKLLGRCPGVRNPSTRSIRCACWAGGCVWQVLNCRYQQFRVVTHVSTHAGNRLRRSQSPTSLPSQRRAHNPRARQHEYIVNIRMRRNATVVSHKHGPASQAWTEFDDSGRMKASELRNRVVDVAEELFKFTLMTRPHASFLVRPSSEFQVGSSPWAEKTISS